MLARESFNEALLQLRREIQGDLLLDDLSRTIYASNATLLEIKPLAIVAPKNKGDVMKVVRFANENNITIHPRGAGTALAGNSSGPGLLLDFFKHMNSILEINVESSYAKVQPGLTLGKLNDALQRVGKFLPPNPLSEGCCTIGGMIATNASGPRSLKYGSTSDYVLSLDVVLPDGRLTNTSGMSRKTNVFISSRGFFGIIVEAKIKILELPESAKTVFFCFSDRHKAHLAISELVKFHPTSIELMDERNLREAGDSAADGRMGQDTAVLCVVEFDGVELEVKRNIENVGNVLADKLGLAVRGDCSLSPQCVQNLRQVKKNLFPSLLQPVYCAYPKKYVAQYPLHNVKSRNANVSFNENRDIPHYRKYKTLLDPKGVLNPYGQIRRETELDRALRGKDIKPVRNLMNYCSPSGQAKLAEDLTKCTSCGTCKALSYAFRSCPVFKATLDERYSPKGKIKLLGSLLTDGPNTPGLDGWSKVISVCLNCRSCVRDCPFHLDLFRLSVMARANHVAEVGLEKPYNYLGDFENFFRLAGNLAPMSNWVSNNPLIRRLAEKMTGIDRRRRLPPFTRDTFKKWFMRHRSSTTSGSEQRGQVAFFVDTFIDQIEPQAGVAVVEALERNGYEVVVPKQFGSGLPSLVYGDLRKARRIAQFNVEGLWKFAKEGTKIICATPGATSTLRIEYPELLDSEEAFVVSDQTEYLYDFLVGLHQNGMLDTSFVSINRRLTYQIPCHLRNMTTTLPSLQLLKLIPGLSFESVLDACCGLGGSFGFAKGSFDLSMNIGKELFGDIMRSKADLVVSDCEGCCLQIREATNRRAMFPISLLKQAYSGSEEDIGIKGQRHFGGTNSDVV